MNLTSAAIVLRERSSLEIVDLAVRFVRSLAPLAYLKLSAAVLVPLYAGCLALRYVFELSWAWVWLAAWVGGTVAQGPFTLLAGRLLFADDVRTASLLIDFGRRLPVYCLLLAARALLALLSFVTLVGPLVVWAYLAYLHEILYLESASLRAALGRSRRFVRGRSGSSIEMLTVQSCVLLTSLVLFEVMGMVAVGFVLQIDLPVDRLTEEGGSLFSLAGLLAALPLTSTLRFLFYVNERTLRDGWDVQVRFLGIRDGLQQSLG